MNYNPVKGKILVTLEKPIMVTRITTELDEEKNKGKGPNDLMETKKVKSKVKSNFQRGTILAVTDSPVFNVGDVIVYRPSLGIPFELIKDTILVDEYGIVGKWEE